MKWVSGRAEPENEVERVAFEAGIESVLRIRCLKHRHVQQYNTEASGAECPSCSFDALTREGNEIRERLHENLDRQRRGEPGDSDVLLRGEGGEGG